ncbi:hypothetical protein NF552_23605 (plasmid) [Roseomonas mucosa]|nr:hypothetical protein NF552_23605 [Roseomonas mucosa]
MAPDPGPQGTVLRYPYLWLSQSRAGEDSGRKERPVCLVLRVRDEKADLTHLALLAISASRRHPVRPPWRSPTSTVAAPG